MKGVRRRGVHMKGICVEVVPLFACKRCVRQGCTLKGLTHERRMHTGCKQTGYVHEGQHIILLGTKSLTGGLGMKR